MTPLLKSFVYFDRHPDGVFFRTGADAFVLKGKGIYPVVVRLLELFDGSQALPALTSRIPDNVRPLFDALLRELLRREFVIDGGAPEDDATRLREDHPVVLAYLGDHRPEPLRAFARWHAAPILITGEGAIVRALVRALAGLGAGRLYRLGGDAADGDASVIRIDAAGIDALPAHATLHAADRIDVAALDALPPARRPALVAGGLGGRVIVAPGDAFGGDAGLEGRLHPPRMGADIAPAAAALALAGNLLAHQWFLADTGIAAHAATACKLVNPDLTVDDFPLDPAAASPDDDPPPESAVRELTEFERFWHGLKPLFADATGLFEAPDDDDAFQLPLHHREIVLRPAGGAGGERVREWGMGIEEAGRRAIRRAAERHAMRGAPQPLLVRAGLSAAEARARLALTVAWLDADLKRTATRTVVDFQDVAGETLVLWRLAMQMASGPIAVTLLTWPDRAGAVAEVTRDGAIVAWDVGERADDAIRDALGTHCSALQLGAPDAPDAPFAPLGEPRSLDTLARFGIHLAAVGPAA